MAVSDTSVLLAFCILDKMDVLTRLSGKIVVPFAVKTEVVESLKVLAPGVAFPDKKTVEVAFVDVTEPGMNQSEAETLELAGKRKAKIVLSDDHLLRKTAKERGFLVVGTAGMLYAAKLKGLIEDVGPAISDLDAAGYTVSANLVSVLRRRVAK